MYIFQHKPQQHFYTFSHLGYLYVVCLYFFVIKSGDGHACPVSNYCFSAYNAVKKKKDACKFPTAVASH